MRRRISKGGTARRQLRTALGVVCAIAGIGAGCAKTRSNPDTPTGATSSAGAAGHSDSMASLAGDGNVGGAGQEASIPLDELTEPLLQAVCEQLERCGRALEYEQVPGGCVAARRLGIAAGLADWAQRVADGTATYDSVAAAGCVEAHRNRRCDDPVLPSPCGAALDGTVSVGGACTDHWQCAGYTMCGCNGCIELGKTGDACDETRWCAENQYCQDHQCTPLPRDGDACEQHGNPSLCAGGQPCVHTNGSSAGACQSYRAAKLGEACGADLGLICESGSACAVVELTESGFRESCVERAHSAGECQRGLQDSCPAGEYCPLSPEAQAAGTLTASCLPLGIAGEACSWPYGCLPGSVCTSRSVCVKLGANGNVCESNAECDSRRCKAGVCTAPRNVCTDDEPPVVDAPMRPESEQCPTTLAGPGQLLASFDDEAAISTWSVVYGRGGDALIDWSEVERFSCSGALHVHAKLVESNLAAYELNMADDGDLWDWSSFKRLHAWVRVAAPGVSNVGQLLTVATAVSTRRADLTPNPLMMQSVDAAQLGDFAWHELVLDLAATDLARVDGYGIGVLSELELPANAPAPLPELDVYLDDVWLE